MAFDLTRTRYFLTSEVPVAPGHSIAVEGGVLKQIRTNGLENAALTEGIANEVIIGFSENNNLVIGVEIVTETIVVPTTGVVSLKQASIIDGTVWAYDASNAAALSEISSGSPTSAQFLLNPVQGIITLNTSLAGITLQVRYKYNLTALQQLQKYGGRPVNMRSNTDVGTVTVIRGFGNMYTDQYDTTVDFSSATTLYATAGGIVTNTAGSNNTVIPGARVISVPTAADPFLGFTFNLP
jgi:hypothetical protein